MHRVVAVFIVALGLGGCALLRELEPHAPAPREAAVARQAEFAQESEEVGALLAYYQRVQNMPAEELRREYQNANVALGKDKTEFSRLRLALLYSVPGAAWRDDGKLLALLDASAARNAPAESPRRQFVTLLQKLVTERQREQHRADELQRRADELQQKLDAMLEIERSLRSRKKAP